MAVAFHAGQTLGSDDLKIAIRNTSGVLVDPFYIRYSLFDNTTGVEVLIGIPDRVPATSGTGLYYVDATLPRDSNIGDWLVRWNFRETAGSPLVQVVQEFNVVQENVTISITGDQTEDLMIRRLRVLLRDNNPDRNYRFRPPAHEKFLQAQAQVFGYIWEDEELYDYLLMAVDLFNSAPPVTGVDMSNMPQRWRTTVLLRAAGFACAAVAMNWIADEFSVGKDEKINVKVGDREKTIRIEDLFREIYAYKMAMVHAEAAELVSSAVKDLQAENGDLGFEPDPYSVEDDAQDKVGEIKKAFEEGALYVKALFEGEDTARWTVVGDVLRHSTLHKDLYKVTTEIGSVVVTEDHSLFLHDGRKEVKASELSVGDLIIGSEDKSSFGPVLVLSVEEVESEEYTYDLAVPGPQNFMLDTGILAHNSYSISGVSLDIEKSSKYESMKNNFIGEYDKAAEAVKRSIKITKGLSQPRYGIGISSALGPYSRPGVQSRRNYVSGFRGGWV